MHGIEFESYMKKVITVMTENLSKIEFSKVDMLYVETDQLSIVFLISFITFKQQETHPMS